MGNLNMEMYQSLIELVYKANKIHRDLVPFVYQSLVESAYPDTCLPRMMMLIVSISHRVGLLLVCVTTISKSYRINLS